MVTAQVRLPSTTPARTRVVAPRHMRVRRIAAFQPPDWQSPSEDHGDNSEMEDPLAPALDDEHWDVFLPEDPYEPQPDPDDFWIDAGDE